jgi:hypothetical protein
VLGERPQAIVGAVVEALNRVVPPVELARHLTLAAAWRLARFPESNDIEDWFAPMHTFSFCNALHRVLARGETGMELVRGLFHGAMSKAFFRGRIRPDGSPDSTRRQLFLEVFAKNDWNCGTISVPLQCGH